MTRLLGLNPGSFTLQGTNTYLVGTGEKRILVDTGDGSARYLAQLKATLREADATLGHVVITHDHEDHHGLVPQLRREFPGAVFAKRLRGPAEKDPSGRAYDIELENGTIIAEEGATLRAVLTPGHAADHAALVLEEEGSVFTGDCVLGSGTAVFEDLHQYMGSLRILQRELEELIASSANSSANSGANPSSSSSKAKKKKNLAGRLYPGHGALVLDGVAKIKHYIAHRLLREDQILAFLSAPKHVGTQHSVVTLVEHLYSDQNLNWVLKRGATRSVTQHLHKLVLDGKVSSNPAKTHFARKLKAK